MGIASQGARDVSSRAYLYIGTGWRLQLAVLRVSPAFQVIATRHGAGKTKPHSNLRVRPGRNCPLKSLARSPADDPLARTNTTGGIIAQIDLREDTARRVQYRVTDWAEAPSTPPFPCASNRTWQDRFFL